MSHSKRSKRPEAIARTKRYYEKGAAAWTQAKTNSFHHEIEFTRFASLLKKGSKVIDIGCAWGIHVPLFLGIGRHLSYTGIDIARSFLTIARRRYPQLSFNEADITDATSLPRTKFDGFLAVAVLMHVPYELWDDTFDHIERLMKPHAIGYITLPIAHPSGERVADDSRHFTILTEKEQIAYLKNRGWKIRKRTIKNGSSTKDVWRGYIVELP